MQIETRTENGVLILDISGTLDGGPQSRIIHHEIRRAIEDGHKKILLNMTAVPWANTLGIGVLIAAFVSAKRMEGQLKMFGTSERVGTAMRLMRLIPEIFDDLPGEKEGLESFS